MYSWIWEHLPGPVAVRVIVAALLIALIVVVLFGWVFPWVAPHLPVDNVGQNAQAVAVEVP